MNTKELLSSIKQEQDAYAKTTKIFGLKEYIIDLMNEKGIDNNGTANPIRWNQLHKLLKVADSDLKELLLIYADNVGIYIHPSIKRC